MLLMLFFRLSEGFKIYPQGMLGEEIIPLFWLKINLGCGGFQWSKIKIITNNHLHLYEGESSEEKHLIEKWVWPIFYL